jgi:hypothetical protein
MKKRAGSGIRIRSPVVLIRGSESLSKRHGFRTLLKYCCSLLVFSHVGFSVLTWRIVVHVVRALARTLTSLDVSRNAGVDLEVRPSLLHTSNIFLYLE